MQEESKKYDFEILFEKIEEAKKQTHYVPCVDNILLEQVITDIESLRGHIEAINESQYATYARS